MRSKVEITMYDREPPCAADALFGTRTTTINGTRVGIVRLCDAITAVQALNIPGDEEITKALLREVCENNYIAESLQEAYGKALLGEYRAFFRKPAQDR